jgi:two-component system, LytTR family, sensor kinase
MQSDWGARGYVNNGIMRVRSTVRSKLPSSGVTLVWLMFALVSATQAVLEMVGEGMHHPWARLFLMVMLSWIPWLFGSPWVIWLSRQHPPTEWRDPRTWLRHLSLCAALALVYAIWIACLQEVLRPFGVGGLHPRFIALSMAYFISRLNIALLMYVAIVAITHTLDARARLSKRETEAATFNAQLARAELDALRRQLEPHFLFNTLNAIAGLLRENRIGPAITAIMRLGDLLRNVLDASDKQFVSLGEELQLLESYVSIQVLRFGERLHVSLDIPEELRGAQVPSLLLQPLVENAIQHGIAKRAAQGLVLVSAARSAQGLTIRVSNDGPLLPVTDIWSEAGVGLTNVRTRLQMLYGENCLISLRNRDEGGVEALVSLPYTRVIQ